MKNSFDIKFKSELGPDNEPIPLKVLLNLFKPTRLLVEARMRPCLFNQTPKEMLRRRPSNFSDPAEIAAHRLEEIAKHLSPGSIFMINISSWDMPDRRTERLVSDAMYFIGHESKRLGFKCLFWHKELKVIMSLPDSEES